jgi:predicted nucleic acid-binding protein
MPGRRRIVPDASVILPAYLPEEVEIHGRTVDLSRLAKPLVSDITDHTIVALAPHLLLHEFLKRAQEKNRGRSEKALLPLEELVTAVDLFLALPVRRVDMHELAQDAWRLMTHGSFSAADSWYLACAIHHNAELWLSHEHQDGFVKHAREEHQLVFTLSETPYRRATR